MAFREVDVVEIREVLRGWLDGGGLRTIAERAGVDRKTARRYVQAAQAAGLVRDAGPGALGDDLIGAVVEQVRPARPNGHGAAWEALTGRRAEIAGWVAGGTSLVKIEDLLARSGTVVPYRTLHRFATAECGFRPRRSTVRVLDGDPGVECQIDFAQMGFIVDAESGRRRKVHALILTAVYSRHMFVHLSYGQTLADVIAGCDAAWTYFGGVFKVLISDNLKPVVIDADPVNPRFSVGWLDYSQHVGFGTDPARVRSPQDKPRVERIVQYVRGNFFDGENFTSLDQAQAAARRWCTDRAGMRIHGTIAARPLEVFTEHEASLLLPVPAVYDVPLFRSVKVHRDHHVEIGKALYSMPSEYIGSQVQARADAQLVKLFYRGRLVKTHPRQRPGGRHTDPDDLPSERVGYAMRDLERLQRNADQHGWHIGIYVFRLLDDPLPWTRMRAVYRLLHLVRRYDPAAVDAACRTALDLDVISVTKISAMLAKALESTLPELPAAAGGPTGRFARDPSEFTPAGRRRLHAVPDLTPTTETTR
ncbi:IS21 family transposase [Nakamurella sp.]|uniref:IS21 family transposase n=1 Tax=Nakamurella sp. TaxID=1869182 RepID=UPI003B3A69EF